MNDPNELEILRKSLRNVAQASENMIKRATEGLRNELARVKKERDALWWQAFSLGWAAIGAWCYFNPEPDPVYGYLQGTEEGAY